MWVFKVDRPSLKLRFELLSLVLLLILGVAFRCINLDRKVFWVDEVATAIRVAGYTKAEVIQQLDDNSLHTPAELLIYQQRQPDRSFSDTLKALHKSPEHAPLYFLLLRGWTQLFGSSIGALRSFSVLCSLLLLPAIFWLSHLLWKKDFLSWITVGLMAISPFMIAYAQEARPYSLWLLTLVFSSGCLLKALNQPTVINWGLYAIALIMGLYTSLLTSGVAIGQVIYVLMRERCLNRSMHRLGIALLGATMAVLPWLWVLNQQWDLLQTNTTWMRMPLPHFAKAVIWFYSVAVLYFDVPVILNPPIIAIAEIGAAVGVVAVILYAFYYVICSQAKNSAWFLLTLAFSVPLLLISLDLITDGRYSTAPRYFLPFHLAAQLAVAFLLGDRLRNKFQFRKWQGIAFFLLTMCLLSNLINLNTSPKYLKNRNLNNQPIAEIVNQAKQPILLTESINTIDLISLSHSLDQNIQVSILPTEHPIDRIQALVNLNCREILLFNPSPVLQQQLQQSNRLEQRYYPKQLLPGEFPLSLWQISTTQPHC